MELSKRAKNIAPSATAAAAAAAQALKAQGVDVISLTLGEPDFVTPKNIQAKAIESITNGKASFYTATGGIPELKTAIQAKISEKYGHHYKPNQILVSPGAKFSLYAAFQVLLNPGDEVLIPTPYWVSYSEQIKLAEGVPVLVAPKDQVTRKATPADLEKFVTPATKGLLLNSPSNPSGMIYTREELLALGQFAVEHDLFIIADDIYSNLVYNGAEFTSIAMLSDEITARTLVITGVSKTYAMTGWRIGFALGDEKIIKAMTDLQSQATSNPTTVSQYAALASLTLPQDDAENMRQSFEQRLNIAYDALKDVPGFNLVKPQGAFYLFPDVTEAMDECGYTDVDDFVADLLTEAHVAVVSGRAFGVDSAIRLSYAVNSEVFLTAVKRILAFVTRKRLK